MADFATPSWPYWLISTMTTQLIAALTIRVCRGVLSLLGFAPGENVRGVIFFINERKKRRRFPRKDNFCLKTTHHLWGGIKQIAVHMGSLGGDEWSKLSIDR